MSHHFPQAGSDCMSRAIAVSQQWERSARESKLRKGSERWGGGRGHGGSSSAMVNEAQSRSHRWHLATLHIPCEWHASVTAHNLTWPRGHLWCLARRTCIKQGCALGVGARMGGGTEAENLLTQKASYETKACMPAEAAATAGHTEKDDGYTSRCLERGVRGCAVNGEEVPSPAKRCLFFVFTQFKGNLKV